jgi:hypothetical protein
MSKPKADPLAALNPGQKWMLARLVERRTNRAEIAKTLELTPRQAKALNILRPGWGILKILDDNRKSPPLELQGDHHEHRP